MASGYRFNVDTAVPPTPDLLGGAFSSFKQNVFDKFTRTPPTVDTSAANRAFARQDQLTPISASTGSQAISPKTPMHGRLGVGSAADDAFSPAIAGSPRRPGGYGGFSAEPESEEGEAAYGTSPNKQASNLLTRMNSIAPGPFEVSQTQLTAKSAFPRSLSRDGSVDLGDDAARLGSSIDRPGTAASGSSFTSGSISLPKMPRKNGYGGFGPPQKEGESGTQPPAFAKRSETFPDQLLKSNENELQVDGPIRAPSAPGLRPDRPRRPSHQNGERPPMTSERKHRPSYGIRDTSRPPPPRTSLIRPTTRDGSQNLSINLADEFGAGNPYHSPSISQSSSNSGFSQISQTSHTTSNTSPARSVGSRSDPRRPSDTEGLNALMEDLQKSIIGGPPASPMTKSAPIPMPGPRKDSLKPAPQRIPSQNLRLDPAVQPGRDIRAESPISPKSFPNPDRLDTPLQEGQSRMRSLTASTVSSSSHNRQPSRNPRPRGNCKACQEPITGKSIASADGRLTGRYHKACFVCATCKEPFTSATFYVHEDRPYCEQHYHKLNGSLCGSCNRGIEGQYLEDEVPQKYHPGCFRCGDCGVVLRDGYFDVNGKSYCERDAWRRMQSAMRAQQMGPPPSPRMQQRQGSSSGPSTRPPPASGGGGNGSGAVPSIREPPRGLPVGPSSNLHRPFGLPTGQRLMPGQALGRGGLSPMQKMEKRRTRLGMM
ncbi:putative LIM domain-containing protein [Rosellinia necatrix]|uniref:Putative LIM domain-containing protein n=1 Tax=Rosellinia necatrix TaxID=77044 RepID=A0A1S7UMU2_ROSNE|nr:putative LIM domain-containing protein [Rosellinia necatrix]